MGGLAVHWYGLLVAIGFLAGLWTASRRGPLAGVSAERVLDAGPWIIVGALVGARMLFVISYWEEAFAGKPFYEVFMIHHGGLVYYGGLIGASLGTVLFCMIKRVKLWVLADVMAPSIALGNMFGRLGCFFNGCCYGAPSALPWAISYPPSYDGIPSAPVHPTQIYDSLFNLLLYVGLAWLFRRRKFDGQVFAVCLLGYAVMRSIVELFRGDYAERYLGVITPAHMVSVLVLITGAALYTILRRQKPVEQRAG
jgi:phosphatidylglycerol---prolipoprotein diacylglyceryl transferase